MGWSQNAARKYKQDYDAQQYFDSIKIKKSIKKKHAFTVYKEISNFVKEAFPQFSIEKNSHTMDDGSFEMRSFKPTSRIMFDGLFFNFFEIGDPKTKEKYWNFEIGVLNSKVPEILKNIFSEKEYNFIMKK